MPSSSYRLKSVTETKNRFGVYWNIVADRSAEDGYGRMWICFDMWLASLCQRAIESNAAVMLTWHPSRKYGDTLTGARILATGEYAFERALEADR